MGNESYDSSNNSTQSEWHTFDLDDLPENVTFSELEPFESSELTDNNDNSSEEQNANADHITKYSPQEIFNQEFVQHPGVRTLEGVDAEGVAPNLVAGAELLHETSERLAVNEVPYGGVLYIRTPNGETTRFRRNPNGQFVFINNMEELESDKEELPVKMIGTTITPSVGHEATNTPNVVKGFYFHFATEVQFRDGSSPEAPELFKEFGTPEELDPGVLAAHLKIGMVFEGDDGHLYWDLAKDKVVVPVESFDVDDSNVLEVDQETASQKNYSEVQKIKDQLDALVEKIKQQGSYSDETSGEISREATVHQVRIDNLESKLVDYIQSDEQTAIKLFSEITNEYIRRNTEKGFDPERAIRKGMKDASHAEETFFKAFAGIYGENEMVRISDLLIEEFNTGYQTN